MSIEMFSDSDYAVIDSIISRYPRKRSAIMPLLHYVQSKAGYVTNEGYRNDFFEVRDRKR
jgi:NADH-quinone oxidoreductase subunit E